MGLDSFWYKSEWVEDEVVQEELVPEPPENARGLVGGMFSKGGYGSFRGKVYDDFIHHVTGISLYQEVIPASTVVEMANDLESYEWTGEDEEQFRFPQDEEGFNRLSNNFKFYSERFAELHGWW